MLGDVRSTRWAGGPDQPEQRIGRTAGVAKQELDALADQVRPSPVGALRQRS